MGDVVGGFKSICTIALNKSMSQPGARPLHENFYEHIIRDMHELEMIREYIVQNPQRWRDDPERPQGLGLPCPTPIACNRHRGGEQALPLRMRRNLL
jgi:hypothetical protein